MKYSYALNILNDMLIRNIPPPPHIAVVLHPTSQSIDIVPKTADEETVEILIFSKQDFDNIALTINGTT